MDFAVAYSGGFCFWMRGYGQAVDKKHKKLRRMIRFL